MGVTVEWDDEKHTVLRYTVSGRWTWDDLNATLVHARQLADSTDAERVKSLIDIRNGSLFPQNALLHFRGMSSSGGHPKMKSSPTVMVGDNLFVKAMMDIMRRLSPQAMQNFYVAATLDEARALLIKVQTPSAVTPQR